MADTTFATDTAASRMPGFILIGCALASIVLLANHPGGDARTFLDLLRDEAGHRQADAVVHGGFIAVLVVELAAFAMLAVRLSFARLSAIAAVTFVAAGAVAFSASMTLDGLVVPAIAAKYLAQPVPDLVAARTLIVLCNLLIQVLMPIGLAFQSAANIAWGIAFLRRPGVVRFAGMAVIALGAVLLVALVATIATPNPIVLMAGIAAQALWVLGVGLLTALRRV